MPLTRKTSAASAHPLERSFERCRLDTMKPVECADQIATWGTGLSLIAFVAGCIAETPAACALLLGIAVLATALARDCLTACESARTVTRSGFTCRNVTGGRIIPDEDAGTSERRPATQRYPGRGRHSGKPHGNRGGAGRPGLPTRQSP